jgi:DNA mismatch repair protein MutL
LTDGGTTAIVVRDDGEGIEPSDLDLAVERHATSKIQTEQDLTRIHTLGFRGEALASIAAVARVRIASRRRDAADAYELEIEAGARIGEVRPAARGGGTTVEVRDLFFNLPARARFLGSPRTEFLHCSRVVQRGSLLYPTIGWELTHGEREAFRAPPATTLLDRLVQVYGSDVGRTLIPIEGRRGEIAVRGAISRPDLRRSNRRDQLFVVNGRPISDRGLAYVLASAYRGLLRPGAFPLAVIQIEMPPDEVDVNVHPRKEEVRFENARKVQDAVAAALHQALSSPQIVTSPLRSDTEPGPAVVRSEKAADGMPRLDLGREVGVTRASREAEKVRVNGDRRVIGQLHATYLLVESPDGLEIIDQHIAHERILYERLKHELAETEVTRQLFLLPVRIELSFEAAAVASSYLDELARFGIVLEEFGGGTFLLREYPRMLAEAQTRRGFQEVLEAVVGALAEARSAEGVLYERLVSALACGAAIRAGETVTLHEAQRLVEQLMTLENPYSCPHGRPIISAIPLRDLDRKFKRR